MAFIIRKGQRSARLIRRLWVKKGEKDNAHGYAEDVSLGTLPLTATDWPPEFESNVPIEAGALTDEERAQVKTELFDVATLRAEALRLEAAARQLDPAWRVHEAMKWLMEAAPLCKQRPLDGELLAQLVASVGSLNARAALVSPLVDPVDAVILAAQTAAAAVSAGHYGTRPSGAPMKGTPVNNSWAKVRAAVNGKEAGSLMRALQDTGWVKKSS